MDWTCRFLENGPQVYAFHTLNLRTRACAQTIATDKRTTTVQGHVLEAWKTLGIPDFLQLDNDAAFCGGYKVPRVFGQFVRLCLDVGIELIFLLVAEPERNGAVDGADFLLWQRGGSPNPLSAGDLDIWKAAFGGPAIAAVPEPTAALLMALGMFGSILGVRRMRAA